MGASLSYLSKKHGHSASAEESISPSRFSASSLLQGSRIALSRAYCSFEARPLPINLSGEKLRQALLLGAKASSPHPNPGVFIHIGEKYASLWTWNKAELAEFKSVSERKIVPESALHRPASGPVLRETLDGYEGQIWKDGELVASRWWSRTVPENEWSMFCLSGERFGVEPVELPYVEQTEFVSSRPVSDLPFGESLKTVSLNGWTALIAILLLLPLLYFSLRYVYLGHQEKIAQARYEALWQEKAELRASALKLNSALRETRQLSSLYNAPHPIPPLSVAVSAITSAGGTVERVTLDDVGFAIIFRSEGGVSQTQLVEQLEADDSLTEVSVLQGDRPNLWQVTFSYQSAEGSGS